MAPIFASGSQHRGEELRQGMPTMGGQVGLTAKQSAKLSSRPQSTADPPAVVKLCLCELYGGGRVRRRPAACDGALQQDVPYLLRVEACNVRTFGMNSFGGRSGPRPRAINFESMLSSSTRAAWVADSRRGREGCTFSDSYPFRLSTPLSSKGDPRSSLQHFWSATSSVCSFPSPPPTRTGANFDPIRHEKGILLFGDTSYTPRPERGARHMWIVEVGKLCTHLSRLGLHSRLPVYPYYSIAVLDVLLHDLVSGALLVFVISFAEPSICYFLPDLTTAPSKQSLIIFNVSNSLSVPARYTTAS